MRCVEMMLLHLAVGPGRRRLITVVPVVLAIVAVLVPVAMAAGPNSCQGYSQWQCPQPAYTQMVSVDSAEVHVPAWDENPAISANGRYVAFDADGVYDASDPGFGKDVYVRDRYTGTTRLMSVTSSGQHAGGFSAASRRPSLSATGRFVAFESSSTDLGSAGQDQEDVFVLDRDTDQDGVFDEPGAIATLLASAGPAAGASDYRGRHASISGDGHFVAFQSEVDLLPADTNGLVDVYVRDMVGNVTTLVSADQSGIAAGGASPSISADGAYVAFSSTDPDIVQGDNNNALDVFRRDVPGSASVLVSMTQNGQTNGASMDPSISADGNRVAFTTMAPNLGASSMKRQVYARDIGAAATTLVSQDTAGNPGNGSSSNPSISANGAWVGFESLAWDLVCWDGDTHSDVFMHHIASAGTRRVSMSRTGGDADDASDTPAVSGAGSYVAFQSGATDLTWDDNEGQQDIFVRFLGTSSPYQTSYQANSSRPDPNRDDCPDPDPTPARRRS